MADASSSAISSRAPTHAYRAMREARTAVFAKSSHCRQRSARASRRAEARISRSGTTVCCYPLRYPSLPRLKG